MNDEELRSKLQRLMSLPSETEWLEFKEAKNTFSFDKLGEYFSAHSNEANLKKQECGWLVLGITDKPPRKIVGTKWRSGRADLDSLKKEIADYTTDRLTFEEVHELSFPEGRVLMFQIPPALPGIPVAWKGHFYGREGESLGPLNLYEIEQIRAQRVRGRWDAEQSQRRRQCYQQMLNCVTEELQGLGSNPKERHSRSLDVRREELFMLALNALPDQEPKMARLEFYDLLSARGQRLPQKRTTLEKAAQKLREKIQEIDGLPSARKTGDGLTTEARDSRDSK